MNNLPREDQVTKISVITITLNAAHDLQKTLASIICQDYPDLELIVIDGGSKDGSPEVINMYKGHIACWISEPDGGIYDAMNKGLAKATGEWVNFMNAGDTFFDSHVLSAIFNQPMQNAQIIYGDSIAHYPAFRALRKALPPEDLWKGMICCHQAMFFRTNLIRNNAYRPGLFFSADYEMIFRLYHSGNLFRYFHETIAVFDTRGTSNRKMAESARSNLEIVSSFRLLTLEEKRFHQRVICMSKLTGWLYRLLPSIVLEQLLRWRYRHQIIHESSQL
jgi:glycosyltransferase involved in cell wall biosynthesis